MWNQKCSYSRRWQLTTRCFGSCNFMFLVLVFLLYFLEPYLVSFSVRCLRTLRQLWFNLSVLTITACYQVLIIRAFLRPRESMSPWTMRVSERVSHQLLVPDPYQTSPDSSQIFSRMEKRASCHANNWGVLLDDSNVLVNVSLSPVTLNC